MTSDVPVASAEPPAIPRWPRDEVEFLRARAVARPAEVMAYMAAAKLAVLAADSAARRRWLGFILRSLPHDLRGQQIPFVELVNTALICGDADFAGTLIRRRFPQHQGTVELRISYDLPQSNGVVGWQIAANGDCVFVLNRSIFASAEPEFFLNRWSQSLALWLSFLRSAACKAGYTEINVGDAADAAGLAYCSNRPDQFLVPDSYFVNSEGYRQLKSVFAARDIGWNDRAPIVFWRGGTTGRHDGDWRTMPRARLCAIARDAAEPDGFDIGFSHIVQFSDAETKAQIAASGLLRAPCPATAFLRFKYQVDIDGNSNSWPGFFLKLLTGSPVLKIASAAGFRQWYYPRLSAWVHYVPVRADLSDFLERVGWLRNHPAEAAAIGANGRRFAQSLGFETELAAAASTIAASLRPVSGSASGPPAA